VGTGFVVSADGLIATCAHVVRDAGGGPGDTIDLAFHATGDEGRATAELEWWTEPNAQDVAILRLKGTLPEGIAALRLGSSAGAERASLDTYGFPDAKPVEGLPGRCMVLGGTEDGGHPVFAVRSPEISKGFSGAPVWEPATGLVLGMATCLTKPDDYGRQAQTAFLVPSETLRQACRELEVSRVCPYVGLRSFQVEDARFFFGREAATDRLVRRLGEGTRLLAVLGPSGSGKSSVMAAGVVPRVQRGNVPGADRWSANVTNYKELLVEAAIQAHPDERVDLTHVYLRNIKTGHRPLVIIDQFEEFLVEPNRLLPLVVNQLVRLLEAPPPITIVLIMRREYFSRLADRAAALVPWLEQGLVYLPDALEREELAAIVQKPAELVGLRFQEGLVQRIVEDAIAASQASQASESPARSDVLPLLEVTLTSLWERSADGLLTHSAYEAVGRVTGALSGWATSAYNAIDADYRLLARRILLDLVYVGDEEQGLPTTLRTRLVTDLYRSQVDSTSVQQLVKHFADARLLTVGRDAENDLETVSLIHDALLREWPLLRQWLHQDRDFSYWRQETDRRARAWLAARSEDPLEEAEHTLLRGQDLHAAKAWFETRGAELSEVEKDFIHASQAQQEAQNLRELVALPIEINARTREARSSVQRSVRDVLQSMVRRGVLSPSESEPIERVLDLLPSEGAMPSADPQQVQSVLSERTRMLTMLDERSSAVAEERRLTRRAIEDLRPLGIRVHHRLSTVEEIIPEVFELHGRRVVFEVVSMPTTYRLTRAASRMSSEVAAGEAEQAIIIINDQAEAPSESDGIKVMRISQFKEMMKEAYEEN
jgi:energy-coupling factor transporter ATP-binding protein EcfA2